MAKTLELTWVTRLRQWRKRRFVKGKRKDFYFGTGTGKDDRQSYQVALAEWKIKEAESQLSLGHPYQSFCSKIQN